ncbi:phosphoribosylformylglycinamidine synthase II [compost metagenome]
MAVAESCISGRLGAEVSLTSNLRADHLLFSESQSRILLSAKPEQAEALKALLSEQGVIHAQIGVVKGSSLTINVNGKSGIHAPVQQLEKVWKDAIPCLMK